VVGALRARRTRAQAKAGPRSSHRRRVGNAIDGDQAPITVESLDEKERRASIDARRSRFHSCAQ
jgi:hypothetical protein